MSALKELQLETGEQGDLLLESPGFAVWVVSQGTLNPVVLQTLEDYGGTLISETDTQCLLFFFSQDVFLAAAKLEVWSKFNSVPVCMQIFGVKLKCFVNNSRTLDIPKELLLQNIEAPLKLQVYVRPGTLQQEGILSGITLAAVPELPIGFSADKWQLLQADQRLPYKSNMGWYTALTPVGNPLDKNFQIGWRNFFTRIEAILQRNKFRYTVNEYFLVFPLDTLRQLKTWCHDLMVLTEKLKTENDGIDYWPCVIAIAERKGISVNTNIPSQINLDWKQLSPDYPHMHLKDAMLLGTDFQIHPVRFSKGQMTPETWCNVTLQDEETESSGGHLPAFVPSELVSGDNSYCFYCGQRSHVSHNCPTRNFEANDEGLWQTIAGMDMETMKSASLDINKRLLAGNRPEEIATADDAAGVLLRGIFDINSSFQLRSLPLYWRIRGKLFSKSSKELVPEDESPLWGIIRSISSRDIVALDKELLNLQVRFPRDFKVFSLHGFIAMEKGDLAKAEEYWKQAHLLSHPGIMQAWHLMLLARLAEFQHNYTQAMTIFEKALELTPNWFDAYYRRIICLIKSGFADRARFYIDEVINKEPHFFNRFLLDPEVERGQILVMDVLYEAWTKAVERAGEENLALHSLENELKAWFLPESDFLLNALERLHNLQELVSIKNYVPLQRVWQGRIAVERDMQKRITDDIRDLKAKFAGYADRLSHIKDEAAWFPFPKILVEFNRNYNFSAANINWGIKSNLYAAEAFRKANGLVDTEDERIEKMEKRLHMLRLVRDTTLFVLIVSKKFFWIEMIGLAGILVFFPLAMYYGLKADASWVSATIADNQWQIQKGAIIAVTMVAMIFAALWTVIRFESIKEKTFQQAREEAEKRTKQSIERIEKVRAANTARRRALMAKKAAAKKKQGG